MQPGENTTYIQYKLVRGTGPLSLEAKAFVDYRDYHSTTIMQDWEPDIQSSAGVLKLQMFDDATPYFLKSDRATIIPQFDWYEDFYLKLEDFRGQPDVEEDHVYAALIRATLRPGESVTLVATTNADAAVDGDAAYAERRAYENGLIEQADLPESLHQLVLAADQFVVKRPTATDSNGRSIIAGYHWFGDWGRDTMIALPGLTLATNRSEVAASILRTYAQFVDQGMIPNRFPDKGERPEYNTVDATLWYFEALRAYHASTGNDELVRELFPVLEDIIKWHQRGTRYSIQMDEKDGLLYGGEPGSQLTWMDAKIDQWVVTSRIGKPVEINALWFNALCIMGDFARLLGNSPDLYDELAEKVKKGFNRFWYGKMGYCYDVVDGPDGHDGSLRPNQLLAVSLPNSPLSAARRRSVVDACARHLLTAHGMRSLSPDDTEFVGQYGGDRNKRDGAYHQGTVWAWLIGPFVSAHLRVYQDNAQAPLFP